MSEAVSDDLVSLLRAHEDLHAVHDESDQCLEAADEIERLRAALQSIASMGPVFQLVDAVTAAKAALEGHDAHCVDTGIKNPEMGCDCGGGSST